MSCASYIPPSFEKADKLCHEIVEFLLSCGGVYKHENGWLHNVILESIASGQYLLYRDGKGSISHWLCYWKVSPEDADNLPDIKPLDTRHGSVLYIVEHGNKEGHRGMIKVMMALRGRCQGMKGVLWNSKGRGVKKFMNKTA